MHKAQFYRQTTHKSKKTEDVETKTHLVDKLLGLELEKILQKRAEREHRRPGMSVMLLITKKGIERGRLRREQQRDSSGGGISIMRRSFFAVSLFGLLQDGFSHLNKGAC